MAFVSWWLGGLVVNRLGSEERSGGRPRKEPRNTRNTRKGGRGGCAPRQARDFARAVEQSIGEQEKRPSATLGLL
jgi:hypothetical protein